MKTEWEIKSIKHWKDGTWDALVCCTKEGRKSYDRCISSDGFDWKNKYGRKVMEDLQDRLTECVGDMVRQEISWVVF